MMLAHSQIFSLRIRRFLMSNITSPHILVVDDNKEILEALTIVLRCQSYHVTVDRSLDVSNLDIIKPDLILLDKMLGNCDGITICRRLKDDPKYHPIPVVLFSAYRLTPSDQREARADAIMQKPFELGELLRHFRQLLAHRFIA